MRVEDEHAFKPTGCSRWDRQEMCGILSNLSPTDCRLLVDPPAPGPWNMALDEVLWQEAAERGRCTWRFYGWSEPTLSLGYFQPYDDRCRHRASSTAAIVRRISGGGAILHDAELTYSFVLPANHPLAARRLLLYRAVHTALVEALAEFDAIAVLCDGEGPSSVSKSPDSGFAERSSPNEQQPFLCFQRRSEGDVLLGAAKIAGSAQRRSRGAVLQHGSVLLRRSPPPRSWTLWMMWSPCRPASTA